MYVYDDLTLYFFIYLLFGTFTTTCVFMTCSYTGKSYT